VAEVSLVPIVLLSITGLVSAKEVRALPWDSLLVVMGGLLLGGLILDSGLASRVAEFLPKEHDLPWLLLSAFAFLATLLSNFMSNTAAAAILIPLALQALPDQAIAISITIALGSSAATLLPISTPPNAIAASTGLLQTRHFLKTGLFLLLLTPWLFGGLILLLL
jgi:sodium-dependent dicarboxylate transporter 2/3/5